MESLYKVDLEFVELSEEQENDVEGGASIGEYTLHDTIYLYGAHDQYGVNWMDRGCAVGEIHPKTASGFFKVRSSGQGNYLVFTLTPIGRTRMQQMGGITGNVFVTYQYASTYNVGD